MKPATSFCPSRRSGGTRRCTSTSPATATSTGTKTVRMTQSAVAKADQPHSQYISGHYLGQRYIPFNRRGNTSGAYSPNVLAGGFRELRLNGVLGSSLPTRKNVAKNNKYAEKESPSPSEFIADSSPPGNKEGKSRGCYELD